MDKYIVSAIVNDRYCEDVVQAVSEKQAWFKFGKKYGFRMRDFKVMCKMHVTIKPHVEQLEFNI